MVIAFLTVLILSPQNLYASSDAPTIGNESQFMLSADGDAWLTGWKYRKSMPITEVTGAGTNYVVKIDVNYNSVASVSNSVDAEGHCQTDFGDIRFTDGDGATVLDIWMEEYTTSGDATFWVEIADDVSSSAYDVRIYIYYGTSGTSSTTSSGANTFPTFFNKDSTSGWTTSGLSVSTSGDYLRFYNPTAATVGSAQRYDISTPSKFMYMAQYKQTSLGGSDQHATILADGSISHRFAQTMTPSSGYQNQWWYYDGTSKYGGGWTEGTEFIFTTTIDESDSSTGVNHKRYDTSWGLQDSVVNENFALGSPTDCDGLYIGDASGSAVINAYYRWIVFRKWQASEPWLSTALQGSEESSIVVNDGAQVLNPDDTNMLYAAKQYTVTANVSMVSGYSDITTIYMALSKPSPADTHLYIGYTENTDTFSVISHQGIDAVAAECEATRSGTTIDLTYYVTVAWDCINDDLEITLWSYDDFVASDQDSFGSYGTETRLDYSGMTFTDGSGTADRGDYNTAAGITASGTVIYYGGSTLVPDDAVDVYISSPDITTWSDLTLSSGVFSISVDSDDVVGLDTYTFKAVQNGAGSGGADEYYTTSYTDTYIADHITFTATSNESWVLIDDYAFITLSGTYDYDSSTVAGQVWSIMDSGEVTYSTAGVRTWAINDFTNTHGITSFSNTSASCLWEDISMSSNPAYKWFQYSPNEVWLIIDTATFTWSSNATAPTGLVVQSYINGTADDWGIISDTGTVGDLILGGNPTNRAFDSSWYYAFIEIRIVSDSWELVIWSKTLTVDILHSIHIQDSQITPHDNWITFIFHTNWDNATFTIWDNITGTPTEVGFSSSEGAYQIAKPTTVGTHHYFVLINGTHSGSDSTSQTCNTALTSDSWKWVEFKFTVNPITFLITDLLVWQTNDTMVVQGYFLTPNTTITWVLKEAGVQTGSGTLTLVASGEYNYVKWTKADATISSNFTLALTADGSTLTIYGYSVVITNGQIVYSSGILQQGDIYYVSNPEEEAFDVVILIIGIVVASVAIGLGFGINETRKRRPRKRDKSNDGFYRK